VNLASGDFHHSHTDVSVPTAGLPLELTRYYHSGSAINRHLGYGWTHTYDMYLDFSGSDVLAYYADGHAVGFVYSGGVYTPRLGAHDTLVHNTGNGSYTLTSPSQIRYVFDSDGQLATIADRNGNETTLDYDGGLLTSVTDNSATLTLEFEYDSYGRLTTISDPLPSPDTRTVQFFYDSNGDLEAVKDLKADPQAGPFTEYSYDDHKMTSLTDSNGNLALALNVYDSLGRVVEQQDALFNTTCIHYWIEPTYSANCPSGSTPDSNQTIVFDPKRNETIYTFDDQFRLSEVTDAANHANHYTYDSSNNLACLTDWIGRKTASSHDANGNLTELIDANNTDSNCTLKSGGLSWQFEYSDTNDLSRRIDPLGYFTDYIYDGNGNLTRVMPRQYPISASDTDVDGYTDSRESYLGTDANDDCPADGTANNENPDAWPPDFDDNQLANNTDLQKISNYYNQYVPPASARYDLSGNGQIGLSDALAFAPIFGKYCPLALTLTCFVYDSHGLPTQIVESTNRKLPSTATGNCTGNKTLLTYDSVGNLATRVNPRFSSQGSPPTASFEVDAGGRLLSVTDELGNETTSTYDAFNMPLTRTDELGNTTAWSYDAKGNLKTVTDANRATTGDPESGTDCGDAGTGNGADDDDDDVVDDGCPNTIYNYDAADRVVEVIDALGHSTTYGYDENGNLISVTSPNRQAVGTPESGANCAGATGDGDDDDSDTVIDDGCPSTIYEYDELNRPVATTDALGRTTTYAYDDDDAPIVITRTDARGLITEYQLDNLNRIDAIEYWDETHTNLESSVSYGYDDVGNRIEMVDSTGTTTYAYDPLRRLTDVVPPDSDTFFYEYDALGNIADVGRSSGYVYYTYNKDRSLKDATDWLDAKTTYTYDNAGHLTKTGLPNGVWTDAEYDDAGRLLNVYNRKAGPTTISSFEYSLDAVGNRTQMVDSSGTHSYEYDPLYRLTGVTYPGPESHTYTYDPNGDRLSLDSTSYTYDAADELLTAGSTTFDYDENGNQVARDSDTFAYDHENHLVGSEIDSVSSSSTYNGDGLRMSHTVGANTTNYVWEINRGLPVVVAAGADNYIYGLDLIAAIDASDNHTYSTYDGLGSTADLTDDSATVTDTYSYDVFGTPTHATGSSGNPFQFAGQQTDADSGLQYLRARYYDPSTGRFLSEDPVASDNPYAYVGNNPINFVDPSGECRVEVRAHPVGFWARLWTMGFGATAAYHTYIYLHDPTNSSEFGFRGGPKGLGEPFGLSGLNVTYGKYNSSFADFDPQGDDPSVVVHDDKGSCDPIKHSLKEGAMQIDRLRLPYRLITGPNSNSVVRHILHAAGLKAALPQRDCQWAPNATGLVFSLILGDPTCDISAPGWDANIP
jgi:RHS repeat-associated protein